MTGQRRSPSGQPHTDPQLTGNGGAQGSTERARLQAARGWTDEEWDAAAARLVARGLLEPDDAVTAAGTELHRSIEAATDLAAARPWARMGRNETEDLADLLLPVARACAVVLPFPNPVGVPAPVLPEQGR